MTLQADLRTNVSQLIAQAGTPIRLRYFVTSYSGATYDDNYVTQSGTNVWAKALVFPIDSTTGGVDYKQIQQGVLQTDDKKLYVNGSLNTWQDVQVSGVLMLGVGSPTVVEHAIIDNGIISQKVNDTSVYKKIYARILNGGSFYNQY